MEYNQLFGTRVLLFILLLWIGIAALTSYFLYNKSFNQTKANHWVLLGNLTESSISFRIRHALPDDVLDLQVSAAGSSDVTFQTQLTYSENTLVHPIDLVNLTASTEYQYVLSTPDSTLLQEGSFQTAPVANSTDGFRFLASSCAYTGTEHEVFAKMRDQKDVDKSPLLFMMYMGDFHYEDLSTPSIEERVEAMDLSFGATNQKELFANLPIAYMWDDHDFLGNNAGGLDADSEDLQAALEQYQISIPHYPLNATSSMHQAFTIGKVRFIVTDLRSEAGEFVQIMSKEQVDWLLNEFAQSDQYDFVIWASTVPWIGVNEKPLDPSDAWWGFTKQRRQISMFLSSDQLPKRNVLVMAGDSHMVAFDDGSNTYWGDPNENAFSFPILQTGPLDRNGSFKGGPFSDGCFAKKFERNHQYSSIKYYRESDDTPCLGITAYSISDITRAETEVFTQKLCGPDIFQKNGQNPGTCDETLFTTINMVLIILAGVLFLPILGLLLCSDYYESCGFAGLMTIVVTVCLGLVYGIGGGLPFVVGGTDLFDVFSVALIGFFAVLTVLVYMVLWRRVIQQQPIAESSANRQAQSDGGEPMASNGSKLEENQEEPNKKLEYE